MFLKSSNLASCILFALSCSTAYGQGSVADTPPMGWNSYDCFSYAVNEGEVQQNADFMAKNLRKFGWEYVVIDYVWSCPRLSPDFALNQDKNLLPRLNMDASGRLMPDTARFPSSANGEGFKLLAEGLHKQGLKFGIHLMRGIPRQAVAEKCPILGTSFTAADAYTTKGPCGWLNHMWGLDMSKPAAQAYLDSIFRLYAEWGVDFVKVDDLSNPYSAAEVEGYRRAIQNCRRPIVLSLSPGPTPIESSAHVSANANMWRLLGDLWDNWNDCPARSPRLENGHLSRGGTLAGSGHAAPWPASKIRPQHRPTEYGFATDKDEARTMMTLWAISKSPLMFGGNLPDTDPYTLSLITNPEVLAVNQHSVDNQVLVSGIKPMWIANSLKEKIMFLAVFNRSDERAVIPIRLSDLGIHTCNVRDLWLRKDLGPMTETMTAVIPAHDAMLYQLYLVVPAQVTPASLAPLTLGGASYEAESADNTLGGSVRVVDDVPGGKCSGGKLVRFIGSKPENTLRFNKVLADNGGDYIMAIAYMSGSARSMYVSVNGEAAQKVNFPSTGGWDGNSLDAKEVKIHLKQGVNTIEFSNQTDWGVDVDRIVVRASG